MGDKYEKSERGAPGRWSKQEEAALLELVKDHMEWTASQIASLLHRQGFPLRSRAAVLGRLHRHKIALRERLPLPANQRAARESRRKNREARKEFLAKIGGVESPSDAEARRRRHARTTFSFEKTKPSEALPPNMGVFKKHAVPDAKALNLPFASLGDAQCHFPFGLQAPFTYCGLPCVNGSHYCQTHHKLTHTNSTMRPYHDAL